MAQNKGKKIAFISTFNPRKCGIATFTSDLINNISACAKGQFQPIVVAMQADNTLHYSEPVKFEIRQEVKNDYICAADYINFSHVDAVSVQHEFGLFGGQAGSYLDLLLSRLNAPVITTLHTVLDDPSPDYYQSMTDLCSSSYQVITMNQRGINMLRDIYDMPEKKIKLIPHGIPDLPFVDSNYYKHKFGMEHKKTILTFGLLSRNKGIELMLQAMPEIIKAEPSALYVILGMTHPLVLKHEGESYRFSLQRMVKELGITKNVIFHNRFVKEEELYNFLCATDIYVTPYLSREQLTSGTLSFAVGAGKAVISTPYWAAEELLAEGRGIIVPFKDHKRMAEEIIRILNDEKTFYSLRRRAYDYGRSRTWPQIGKKYWEIYNAKSLPVLSSSKPDTLTAEYNLDMNVPEPSLAHLKKLTDDTGMLQHARLTIPNRQLGYTTDDNARALMVMNKYYNQNPDPEALRLFDIYLSFVMYAQDDNGNIKNEMSYDRKWIPNEPPNDALGRTLMALGSVMANPPSPSYLSLVKECFDKSVEHIPSLHPRSMAYAVLGMSDYLKQFPGASDIKRYMAAAADELVTQYEQNRFPDWQWFEDILTYDNAILPHALLMASKSLDDKYLQVAIKTCKFLIDQTYNAGHFSFIGCNGWYERDRTRAKWDQQPVEAAGTVMMLHDAYEITKDKEYLKLQRKAFDWFLGANDLHIPVYNFRSRGCHDGLTPTGVNQNEGAESTLSFLLALLTVIESYSVAQKILKTNLRKKNELTEMLRINEIKTPESHTQKTQELK
ncbi:MAG: glycosyltransferase [Sedimentisphaerales bacterium]|nr:glycosyltransferase [Sedimentisphaerales bacterium]